MIKFNNIYSIIVIIVYYIHIHILNLVVSHIIFGYLTVTSEATVNFRYLKNYQM